LTVDAASVATAETVTQAIDCVDLSYQFATHLAVDHVNLSIAPGEMYGLLGPNGAGKTTTIRMITTLLTPGTGSVRVFGIDAAARPMLVRLCLRHYKRARRRGELAPIEWRKKHGMYGTPTYKSWHNMVQRCSDPKCKSYTTYGAKGRRVCERLLHFAYFYDVLGERLEGTSIDRKDNDGNYSCGKCEECKRYGWIMNVKWSTPRQQILNQNLRRNNISGYRGVTWYKPHKKWQASIGAAALHPKTLNLGYFTDPAEGANKYDQFAIQLMTRSISSLRHPSGLESYASATVWPALM
jgi:energy-coupling factor transporter ATP-binding protein EcfA2